MKGILLLPATLLFLQQVRSAAIASLPEASNSVETVDSKPSYSFYSSPPIPTKVVENTRDSMSRHDDKSYCARRDVRLQVEREGCRPAVLRTKQCRGSTISGQVHVGFNSTVHTVTVERACIPVTYRVRSAKLTFLCNGTPKRETVHFVMPKKCDIETFISGEIVSVPTTQPTTPATTTADC